jgi:hypothetical protein
MLFDRGLSTLADQREVLADAKLGHYFHCRFTRCRDPSELTISPDDKSHASRQMRTFICRGKCGSDQIRSGALSRLVILFK